MYHFIKFYGDQNVIEAEIIKFDEVANNGIDSNYGRHGREHQSH